jgi:hypothetical protein
MNIAYNFITSDFRIRDKLLNNLNISEYLNTRALLLINFTTAISAANPNGVNLFQFISDRLLDPTNHIIFAYDQHDNNKIIGVIIFKIEPSSPSSINVIFHRCIATTREYDEICNILMGYLQTLARLIERRVVVVGDHPPRLLGPGGSMLGGKKAIKARKVKRSRSRQSGRSRQSKNARKMTRRRGGTRKS